ncbi:caspase family protein [Bradyrhizobium aeschynomenes]|uniref:caspase family protein n=1 Tax=Bradyrhizobium aeschynomenes TaxID=2734909 RepID=UPI001555245B|nr:caspase family protein [Bradyrhizobium aeschynomenes]NPV20524.1 caspase family protein [Bradyrhizobium aeschynomenes]
MSRSVRLGGFLLAAALLLAGHPALAEKRVALVIGNSAYQNVPQLTNPANDGAVMTQTFKNAGFDVVDYRRDLTARETRRALRDFADAARDADIAVVYYAGHGMEVEGSNYLIPIDARLERDTDVYDETLSLDRILVAVEPAKKLRLVILDACRDNPFTRNMQRTVATRSLGRGLAKVEPTSPNTLIAYSAKAGSTAQDGDGRNSPFTLALSRHIATPGLDVRKAFGFVRDEVLKSTSNRQEPFVYGSLGGEDVPLVPGVPRVVTQMPVAPVPSPQADIRRDYELAMQVGNKGALNAFLAQYPDGFYASLAKLQLEKLTAEENRAAAAEKARVTEAERARLAAEGARKDTLAKAETEAKAAEQARLAAEKANQLAQQQAAEAEKKRQEQPLAAADNPRAATSPAAAPPQGPQVASLTPALQPADLTKSVQLELRRVGCLTEEADGDWGSASRRSLSQFNRYAGTKLDTQAASADALQAIKLKQARVCPLVCQHGFKSDGDRCTRIVCAEGSFVNDDNECEKRREKKPVAKRGQDDEDMPSRRRARAAPEPGMPMSAPGVGGGVGIGVGGGGLGVGIGAAPGYAKPQTQATRPSKSSGQIYCDAYLCRAVRPGCRLEYRGGGGPANNASVEVCN